MGSRRAAALAIGATLATGDIVTGLPGRPAGDLYLELAKPACEPVGTQNAKLSFPSGDVQGARGEGPISVAGVTHKLYYAMAATSLKRL